MVKNYALLLLDYVHSAFLYEVLNEDVIMSDYEWDMLGIELREHWNEFESPLKEFVPYETLGVTASGINFKGLLKHKLIPFI